VRRSVASPICCSVILAGLTTFTGCGPSTNRYFLIEQSIRDGDPARAAAIVAQAEKEYGSRSRVLYAMDRGLTLQLAGDYQQSNRALEEAEEEVDRLYTRTIRSETAAFLTNDNALPYEGEAYEHVMINVVKALNYAVQGQIEDALVEARRIDHRLNLLSDKVKEGNGYRNDGFARYLTGMLYEAAGDTNNAFIAYRHAFDAYEAMRGWSRTPCPPSLRVDLLRTADALHLTTEFQRYRQAFPDEAWEPVTAEEQLAQVVLISYNGRAPRKEDFFLDLPISLDALQLVLLNRGLSQSRQRWNRGTDTVLYGLSGQVVRVSLPRLVPQKTQVPFERMTLTDPSGRSIAVRSEPAQNVTALAEKSLADRMPGIMAKAVARAATKFAFAEGATRGAQQAAGRDAAPWVGLLVGLLAKGLAVASEEADKRSWQTLPDEIHVARAWVASGHYQVSIEPSGQGNHAQRLSLAPGQTIFLIQRVMQ
jgi:hypothetical protein